jgi:hypothetical protein
MRLKELLWVGNIFDYMIIYNISPDAHAILKARFKELEWQNRLDKISKAKGRAKDFSQWLRKMKKVKW